MPLIFKTVVPDKTLTEEPANTKLPCTDIEKPFNILVAAETSIVNVAVMVKISNNVVGVAFACIVNGTGQTYPLLLIVTPLVTLI